MKLVLVVPPCGFCWGCEPPPRWTLSGLRSELCPVCAGRIGVPFTERRLVFAAA